MKKSIALILIVVLSMSALSGCSSKNKTTVSLNGAEDDSQSYWNIFNHVFARGEKGYYFVETKDLPDKNVIRGDFVQYMDEETGKYTYLCGKPDCNHNNTDCNAYLNTLTYSGDKIYYYDGSIYLMENDKGEGLVYLVRMKADGSARERLFDIGVLGGVNEHYNLTFLDGSVYIYQRQGSVTGLSENTAKIRRRSLDGKEDEVIYEYTGMGAVTYALKGYGDKLFFVVEEEKRKEQNSQVVTYVHQGLFVYDSKSKEVVKYIDKDISDYTIDTKTNQLYYYVVKDGLYIMNMEDNKSKKIYSYEKGQTDICQLSFDGKYLYMSNELYPVIYLEKPKSYELYVMNQDGNILNQVSTTGPFSMYFGDDKYLFSTGGLSEGNNIIKYIKKSEILTQKEWTTLK